MPGLYLSGPLRLHPVYHTPVNPTRRVPNLSDTHLITLCIFAMIEVRGQHNNIGITGPRAVIHRHPLGGADRKISRKACCMLSSQDRGGLFLLPRLGRDDNRGWLCAPVHHNHRAGLAQPLQCMGPARYSRAMDVAALAVSGWRYTRAARPRGHDNYICRSGGGRELARRTTGGHVAGGPAAAACGQ